MKTPAPIRSLKRKRVKERLEPFRVLRPARQVKIESRLRVPNRNVPAPVVKMQEPGTDALDFTRMSSVSGLSWSRNLARGMHCLTTVPQSPTSETMRNVLPSASSNETEGAVKRESPSGTER